jgi:RsiW-degrading membrane proteinase PrsW (M82 family)
VLVRPSTWLLLGIYLVGGVRILAMLRAGFADFPVATITASVLFTLYAVPFIVLLRMIDYLEREPARLQAMAALWGGLVATATAVSGGAAVQNLMAKLGSPALAAQWGQAVSGAAVEELVKVAGVIAIALVAPSHINGVVDGFVYGALVGLGFQTVENIAFSLNAVASDVGADAVGPVIATLLVRGFLSGLWSHTLFTGLAGAGVAYALVRRDRTVIQRAAVAIGLFAAAAGFHLLWNAPVLSGARLGLFGVIVMLLVKGIPALMVGVGLVVAAERRESEYYAGLLAGVADHRVATPDEIIALVSPRRRLAARQRARDRLGGAGARAVRRLQRAQARLAAALSRDPAGEVRRRRREVLRRRHQLLALALDGADRPMRRTTVPVVVIGVVLGVAAVVGVAVAIELIPNA